MDVESKFRINLKLNPELMNRMLIDPAKKLRLLAISIGIIYIIFGVLKFFPNFSPAEGIAKDTIEELTFGLIAGDLSLKLLAVFEVLIGVFLISGKFIRIVVTVTILHLICTFSPLVLMPEQAFQSATFSPSLLGQYILKNLVLICALLAIYPSGQQNTESK